MSAAVLVFVVCVACCAVGHLAILHSVIRTRSAPPASELPRPKFLVEIMWALLPAILLAFLLTATWARVRDRETRAPEVRETRAPEVMMKVAR